MDTNTTPNPNNSLAARIARVMLQINRLPKSGYNSKQNYKYVQDEDVLDTLRPLLAQEGIVVFASVESVEQSLSTSDTSSALHTLVYFIFTMTCETGEKIECRWAGEANDWGDKGVSKAATLAQKYWLLKTFLLSSGDPADDPDTGVSRDRKQQDTDRQRRNQPPAASSAPRASAAHWYQDNAEIKRVAQAIAPKSPTQAATLLGKTLPDFDSADALITAWQAFNAPAQPATPPDQREGEPQREAVPFVVDHFVDTDEMVKPTHWWHDRAQMNLARAATAPRSPEIAAAIIGQSLAHFKSADAFIAAWRAANIPAPAETPAPPSGDSDAARQRAQMQNELVELRRLELRTTKRGKQYWVGKTKDPNGITIEVQFWAEHIDQLMRAGWPIPTPDRNGVMPTEHDCGGMVQLILTHDLRPAQVLPAPMPRRTVTGDALQIGMVIDDHGDFYIITHKHPRFVSACIYTDSDFTMTDMLHHNTDYATREHTVIEHPNAAMILKSLRSEIAAYERRHADRFAPIGAAS